MLLLINTEHRDLRVITARGAAYGDDVMYAPTFPPNSAAVQAHYPIVFGKRRRQLQPLALFGLRESRTCSSRRKAGTRTMCRWRSRASRS